MLDSASCSPNLSPPMKVAFSHSRPLPITPRATAQGFQTCTGTLLATTFSTRSPERRESEALYAGGDFFPGRKGASPTSTMPASLPALRAPAAVAKAGLPLVGSSVAWVAIASMVVL